MSEASYPQPSRLRPEPLWYQVEQAIQAIVKSGEWATGAQIPAEERLCALFGVSRITLRHALRNSKSTDCCAASMAVAPSCAARRWSPARAS